MSEKIIIADIKSNCKDGHSEGHYFAVAQNYTEILSDDFEVQIAGGPIYKEKFKNVFELPYNSDVSESKMKGKLHTILNGIHLLRHANNCTIIFQCSAVSTVIALLAFIKPKAKVFLIQYDRMISGSKARNILFARAKKRIKGIICPGKEVGDSLTIPYCVVPDYIYPGKKTNVNADVKYNFGIYGILSADKGVLEAAEYFSKTKYTLKIAGKIAGLPQDQEMAEKLKALADRASNIDLTIGYLSDQEYNDYIASTKYIVLNYSGVYMLRSSGVILDALYAGKPVLARRRKYVEFVEENGIGILYEDLNDLDVGSLMSDEVYSQLESNIILYLDKQVEQINWLKEFVGE